MEIESVRDAVDLNRVLDDLEHGCDLKEYYTLNHTIPEQRAKLRDSLTEAITSWLNEVGIDVNV